jgi:hypothetical protein
LLSVSVCPCSLFSIPHRLLLTPLLTIDFPFSLRPRQRAHTHREFAEPLLTQEYIETFSVTQQLGSVDLQLYSLQLLVMLLPKVNRACLKLLFDFLALVEAGSKVNKMGFANLAVVFAPTLFYIRGQKGQKMLKEVEMQVSTATTLRIMLENHQQLWNVRLWVWCSVCVVC